MKRFFVRTAFFLICCFVLFAGCSEKSTQGRLGIVVPIGEGKVTKKTPYVVSGVYEGSTAYQAGIRPDDIIIQIDEYPLKGLTYDHIYRNLLLGKEGTKITIVVERQGRQYVFDVVRGGK